MTLGIIPQAEFILFFELGSLIVLELTMHARLVAQKVLGIHLFLLTNSAHTTPTFSHGFWHLSSGPHACMTNISLTEPSPLLRMLFWSSWFLHFLSCVCYSPTTWDPCPAKDWKRGANVLCMMKQQSAEGLENNGRVST